MCREFIDFFVEREKRLKMGIEAAKRAEEDERRLAAERPAERQRQERERSIAEQARLAAAKEEAARAAAAAPAAPPWVHRQSFGIGWLAGMGLDCNRLVVVCDCGLHPFAGVWSRCSHCWHNRWSQTLIKRRGHRGRWSGRQSKREVGIRT